MSPMNVWLDILFTLVLFILVMSVLNSLFNQVLSLLSLDCYGPKVERQFSIASQMFKEAPEVIEIAQDH